MSQKRNENRTYNQLVADETIEDYSLRYAPKSFRKWSEFRIANTAVGSISFLALEAIGAGIGISYGFSTAFWAILVASLIIFITAIPISYHAAKYNIDIDLITRSAGFGYVGSTFTSLIYASFSFIFFALEAAIMAQALELYFGLPLAWGYLFSSLVIIPMVFYGFTFINKLQLFTQPVWITMMVAPFVAILAKEPERITTLINFSGNISKSSEFSFYYFGFALGISLSLIAQIGEQVDYLRFMPPLTKQNRLRWYLSMLLAGPGWIIIGFFKQLGGMFLAAIAIAGGLAISEAKTPIEMYNIGYTYIFDNPAVALSGATFFVIVSQIKINVTNAYAGSLAWSNFFSRVTHSHPGRVVWMLFNITVALFLMELGLFDVLEKILGLYSNVAIAWIGAIFADLVINKPFGLSPKIIEFKRAYLYNVNPVGVGSMGVASLLSVLAFMGIFGEWFQSYSSLLAMFIAIILSPLIAYVTKGKYYIAREADTICSNDCHICNHSYENEDMVYCPVVQKDICSLCCTLDSLCHDSCKIQLEKSIKDKFIDFLFEICNQKIQKLYISRGINFTILNSIVFFIFGVIGWMSYSMHLDSFSLNEQKFLEDTVLNIIIIVSLFVSLIVWWAVLSEESKERAESELEAQNKELMLEKENFEYLFNNTIEGVAVFEDGLLIDMNTSGLEIMKYNEKQAILGKHVLSLISPNYTELVKQKVADKVLKPYEAEALRSDGSIFPVLIKGHSIIRGDKIIRISSFFDLSELKAKEQELEEQKNYLNLFYNNSSVGFLLLDREKNTIDINERLAQMWGYTKEELIGQNEEIYHISKKSFLEFGKIAFELTRQKRHVDIEYQFKRKDGTLFWGRFFGEFINKEDILWIISDITQTKELQYKLLEAKEKAEEATKLKSQFLSNMSHEIRTPMNAIVGVGHLLSQTPLNKKQTTYIQQIKSSAYSLLNIINDILDFSKIEAGKLIIEKIDFNICDLLSQLQSMFEGNIDHTKVSFEAGYEKPNEPIFYGDNLRIYQILVNLTNNAVKFTQKGFIKVYISRQKENILRFEVSDSGIGISKEQQEKLFQSFTQADGSTTRKYGGSGLGLSISKELVELMDGKIWLESEVGVGSRFIFELPLQKGDREKVANREHIDQSQLQMLQASHILLAEDNLINQEIIIGLLENSEIVIDIANNGKEAVDKVKANRDKYELILMDLQMPIMGGIEAARFIQEINAEIPIVALTANAMSEDIKATKKAGMREHLNKPIEVEKLYKVLTNYISQKIDDPNIKIVKDEIIIPTFKHIDSQMGLYHMADNKKLYLKILKDFSLKYKDIKLENLDDETLQRVLHTIKGLSANIGAIALSSIVKELEETLDKALFDNFYMELKLVLDDLKDIQIQIKPTQSTYIINVTILKERLSQIKEYASKRRAKNIKEILEELSQYKLLDDDKILLDKIKEFMNRRDYKSIGDVL